MTDLATHRIEELGIDVPILDEETAAHYGVLGMKWGVRKDRGGVKKAKAKPKAKQSKDRQRITNLANKPVKQLSNKQLKEVNNRFQMEQTLAQMKAKQTTIARGQMKIAAALAVVGTATTIYNVATSPAAKAGFKALKNAYYKYNYITGKTLAITTGK